MNILGWSNDDFDFMGLCFEKYNRGAIHHVSPSAGAIFAIADACKVCGLVMPPTMMHSDEIQAELMRRDGKSYSQLLKAKGLTDVQIVTVMTSYTLGDIEKILAGVLKPISEKQINRAIVAAHQSGMKLD